MKTICVFCGSSYGNNKIYSQAVEALSKTFIKHKITLVYGGAKVGLMGKLADNILSSGGKVIGIIPDFLKKKEIEHKDLTELIEVKSMHERKELMEKLSDGFIALPGGFGTFEEILEMITWCQLNLHNKPCGFLNTNGFYNLLYDFFENTVVEGFVDKNFQKTIIFDSDPEKLIEKFLNYKHHKLDKIRKVLSQQ